MLRTIQIGTCMSVQGLLIRQLDDGRVVIRVDDKIYKGYPVEDRKSTRLNSSHANISYAVFCLKKKKRDQHANYSENHCHIQFNRYILHPSQRLDLGTTIHE